jgi:hypothetical protein
LRGRFFRMKLAYKIETVKLNTGGGGGYFPSSKKKPRKP